ncbi:MAG: hypothetical protein WBW33_06405 [Bryobacteraceae bacterium]
MTQWGIAFLLAVPMLQAQDVPPTPPPKKESGPSLEDTMKFIEEKLNSVAKLTYVVYLHDNKDGNDWTHSLTGEIERVHVSPAECRLDYRWSVVRDGGSLDKRDNWFLLKTVQEIDVVPYEQSAKEVYSKAGRPEWSSQVDPPLFIVKVQLKRTPVLFPQGSSR